MSGEEKEVTFLVVGGGIAGVTCAETLAICCPQASTLLLTESSVIKTVANLEPVARYLHRFDVRETTTHQFAPSIVTIVDRLQHIEVAAKRAHTLGRRCIKYRYLCLCTGARPHLIATQNPRVIGIRDTDSVLELQRRLKTAQRLAIVGNGGIASELAHELQGVKVHWLVKDKHVASTFVDAGAAHFLLQKTHASEPKSSIIKRWRYDEEELLEQKHGAALGPDWQRNFPLQGQLNDAPKAPIMHFQAEVLEIVDCESFIKLKLSNDEELEFDFVVSATGVEPCHEFTSDQDLKLAADGGIAVNEMMQTNLADIFAAGDVCTASWPATQHWFQMRLWTQARQMGSMAGRSMAAALEGETIYQDFCFELFGHVTQLFGYSVVLLGRYNGQNLGNDYEILLRMTPGHEYVKFVLQRGKLRGALLIGNTELAETCENLILNGIDLTPYGDDILNPDIDIEDYFD